MAGHIFIGRLVPSAWARERPAAPSRRGLRGSGLRVTATGPRVLSRCAAPCRVEAALTPQIPRAAGQMSPAPSLLSAWATLGVLTVAFPSHGV